MNMHAKKKAQTLVRQSGGSLKLWKLTRDNAMDIWWLRSD
jgi:hypothetical protein